MFEKEGGNGEGGGGLNREREWKRCCIGSLCG